MASKTINKTLVLTNGERVPVLKEQGKWYICDGRQFRKQSGQIAAVEEEKPGPKKDTPKKKKPVKGDSNGVEAKADNK